MSDRPQSAEERVLELLADEALFGLSPNEQEELDALLIVMPGIDRACMQRAAAAVHLAGMGTDLQPLPRSLHERIRANGLYA